MQFEIEPTSVGHVAELRFLYARELDDIVLYEREIQRGQTRIYAISIRGALIGYGILHGEGEDRSKVVEFFLLPQYRRQTSAIFDDFAKTASATGVLTRTNDTELLLLLHEKTSDLLPGRYCFRDHDRTHHPVPALRYRTITLDDLEYLAPIMTTGEAWPFELADRDELFGWITAHEGRVLEDIDGPAAIGAILRGYNPPFVNIGMVVMKRARRLGYATYVVEMLKRDAYALGTIPRADCEAWTSGTRSEPVSTDAAISVTTNRIARPDEKRIPPPRE